MALHERVFGRRPQGLWPSEGSVSDEVLRLAAEEGFIWAATDEGVLGRTKQMGFYRRGDGTLQGGEELYRPHALSTGGKPISLFFRDHQLSDLIGFVYSRMDPQAAAADLHQRIKAAGRSTGPAAGGGFRDSGRRKRLGVLPRQRAGIPEGLLRARRG